MTIKQEFYIEGMHCAACELVVEDNLTKHRNVLNVKANLNTQKATLELKNGVDTELLVNELNNLVKDFGYTVRLNPIKAQNINYKELSSSFLVASIIAGVFLALQKSGIIKVPNSNEITLPFIFLIGIIASLSSCMAVVGGLVLTLSSVYSKVDKNKAKLSLVKFHLARLIGFFFLGGIIGLIGTAFTLSATASFILSTLLFITMFILGTNLLEVVPTKYKIQITMPKFINQWFQKHNTSYAPVLLGTSTFFLPCGFTQAMQIYSLTTGNFTNGALTMLVFALGTLPALAGISFISIKFSNGTKSKMFFKIAGFLILFFAMLNFLGALTAIGLIPPILTL